MIRLSAALTRRGAAVGIGAPTVAGTAGLACTDGVEVGTGAVGIGEVGIVARTATCNAGCAVGGTCRKGCGDSCFEAVLTSSSQTSMDISF
jgi:hypothetical protein